MSEIRESEGPVESESSVDQEVVPMTPLMHADSKDDLFEDASDELALSASKETKAAVFEEENDGERENVINNGVEDYRVLVDELERFRGLLDKTSNERDSFEKQCKEERETFSRELVKLRHQLMVLTDKELLQGQIDGGLVDRLGEQEIGDSMVDAGLDDLMSECSQFLRSALEERLRSESAFRELNAVLHSKDQEIEDLNAKVSELSVSRDVAASYLNSVASESADAQLEKEQYVEGVADRMLGYLAMVVVSQEELLDSSICGKISHVEKNTYLLIEKYNQMLYEIYQLGQCLSNIKPDLQVQEEFGTVFAGASSELLELKKREVELVEKVSHLENENSKFVEQVEKYKEILEAVNTELSKTKTEVEQEKTRCTNTKEKLSLAVSKGKALVQQRDLLKQSVAEKTTELEKCLAALQEKSSALQAAELSQEELVKSDNLIASLQETLSQTNSILQRSEEILSQTDLPENLQQMDMVERIKWLVSLQETLSQTNSILQRSEEILSQTDLPKNLQQTDMVERIKWLVSLQEPLTQTNSILQRSEEILSQTDLPENLQQTDMVERIKWLVNERNDLKVTSLDFNKLKDTISLIDLPETVSFPDLESRLVWLKESFTQSKYEANVLLNELDKTKEVARNEIDLLSISLSAEFQEKDYVQKELDDLANKYEEIVARADKVSMVKNQIVRMLLEESGMVMEDQDEVCETYSDMAMLVDKCLGKIREKAHASFVTCGVDSEMFERMQSLLYVKNLELILHEQLLEEEMQFRLQFNDLSNNSRVLSEELEAMKMEKDSLQKDLERSEEKSTLVREKLSTAVKKGKGLVQDRQNLKSQLDEKNSEIEKLKLQLQQQESTVSECRDQINRLTTDLESIPKLEADIGALNDQRDQLEQFLLESNKMLQRVFESVDRIVVPVGLVLTEPMEKVNWISGYINECQNAKTQLEQELGKIKAEATALASNLADVQATTKSLENALSIAEDKIARLTGEKREIEVGKENVELELLKAIEEARIQTSKFAEACASRKSIEDKLSMTENHISELINEKEEAQSSGAAAVMELEKVREEVSFQTSKLTEAYKTIKSLEDALSQVETNVVLLTEQNNAVQVGRTTLENELQKMKDEAESQAVELADARTSIKSMVDALLRAESDISALQDEKRISEQEISTLDSKLKACMEELSGTNGSSQSKSVELIGHLNDLQMVMKDDKLLSIVKQSFERKIEGLRNMDLIIKDIGDQVVDNGSEVPLSHPDFEGYSHVTTPFANDPDNIEIENGEMNVEDADSIHSYFRKTAEEFQLRNKILGDKFEGFSSSLDEIIALMSRKLHRTKDEVIRMMQNMESLKQSIKTMETYQKEQEQASTMLENDVTVLLSACSDAARELQFEVKNDLLDLHSVPEFEKLKNDHLQEEREVDGDGIAVHQKSFLSNKYAETAEKLLFSLRKNQSVAKLFESTSAVAVSKIQDLQQKLLETTTAFEKTIEERDLYQNKEYKLETDVDALQDSCKELRLKMEDYQAKEEKLKEKDAEILLLHNRLSTKEQGVEDSLLSASEVKALFDKISGIDIPFAESEARDLEPESSAYLKKLYYIIDSVTGLHPQINLLAQEKENLQSILSTRTTEIEHLKEEVEMHVRNKTNFERMSIEFSELAFGLEKIFDILGGNEFVLDEKSAGLVELLSVLEKQVTILVSEAENSKSKAQELGTKLLGSQKVVDELTAKVKFLEDSVQGRTVQPEIVQERSIFEAPSLPTPSEISEIEDVETIGKNSISPVPSAAQLRIMRKGSSDHLAINIESETASLINNEETDEDKGHVFKSLNTSGLIPKQGKMIADRIDGIWVSGGRVLMSRPGARLGLVAYWIFLNLWLLGTIL
ncbi:hypothetical protein Ddye_031450 [Dipteronia dyeriana]|uniref:Uncharacterized protein n=1 Tax=Dipteronia dyeriana TaxID=168575 RepID=A0AAD9TIV9_9ROSI|nr:hypothetical protein Ddye_031450 [Dipteronia dyeriana]